MVRLSMILPAVLCLWCAVASAQDGATADGLDVERCILTERGALVLSILHTRDTVEAGERIAVTPYWSPFPSWHDAVPVHCFGDWRISNPALATLSADNATITVATDAPGGATFTLSARYRGRVMARTFTIVRRITSPVVGNWRPVQGSCAAGTAISGLSLSDDGSFAVETVRRMHYSPSATGRWRVEGDRLILSDYRATDSSGNPATDFEAEARFTIENGILRFDRGWHGSIAGHGSCNAPLERAQ